MINMFLTGDKEIIAKIDRLSPAVHAALLKKVWELVLKIEAYIKTNKLNGQVLNRRTGKLARSIASEVEDNFERIIGIIFQSADVPYGAIHEFGGKTAAHVIVPKKASVLRFWDKSGQKVFARKVNHPGSVMPERSYMRSSLSDFSTQISLGLKEAVVNAVAAEAR